MNKVAIHRSERIYDFLMRLYPKSFRAEFGEEMKYVFSESLKEAYTENGNKGVIGLWKRAIIDAGDSLVAQHIENLKKGDFMKTKNADIIMQNKVILWIALATGLILLIPLIAMQLTNEVSWTLLDFVIAGVILFGAGLTFVLGARKMTKHRVAIGIVVVVAVIYIWAELAVGIFTTLGS